MIFPNMNFYRTMVSQDEIDTWMLVISPAILLFSVTYFISVRPLTVHEMEQQDTRRRNLWIGVWECMYRRCAADGSCGATGW